MGWEDRQYYRDSRSPGSAFWAILNGSVPLFTAFGIRVRAHASLLILIGSVILLDYSKGYPIQARAVSMGMLGLVIILHEFGHCFAARSVGGDAEDILLWPLGGLAMARPPERPWPTFVTVAGGPLVNVAICLVCAGGILLLGGGLVSLNPFNIFLPANFAHLLRVSPPRYYIGYYLFWTYLMSYVLLLFNLLPIFPLDGGQMLQSILWPKIGYYRSMILSCVVGMVGAGLLGLYALVNLRILTLCVAFSCFLYCRSKWVMLKETGPEEYAISHDGIDYSASLAPDKPQRRKRRVSNWTIRRLRRQANEERMLQSRIDAILAKVSAQGMQSLTWSERRTLRVATERQRGSK